MALRFEPKQKPKVPKRHINLDIEDPLYARAKKHAAKRDISLREFGRQALEFSCDTLDEQDEEEVARAT